MPHPLPTGFARGALSIGLFASILAARSALHEQGLSIAGSDLPFRVQQQAFTLGINDVFIVSAVIALVAVPLSFLLENSEAGLRNPDAVGVMAE